MGNHLLTSALCDDPRWQGVLESAFFRVILIYLSKSTVLFNSIQLTLRILLPKISCKSSCFYNKTQLEVVRFSLSVCMISSVASVD